ncbi:MAG: hypothetical protein CHACPFDD_01270 [Phycisphaerae bacterium]|nr:hypothetical protein [Phycisphaerae bacterium]
MTATTRPSYAAPSIHASLLLDPRPRERRWSHRAPCVVRVLSGESSAAEHAGETVNISTGGIAVQIREAIQPGTRIEALVAHAEQPILVRGYVAHCRRVLAETFEVGLRLAGSATPLDLLAETVR